MKRRVLSRKVFVWPGAALASLFALIAVAALFGQSREAYEQAYRDWRAADPNLERDASKAGVSLGPRTEKAAQGAGNFTTARETFFQDQMRYLAGALQALPPLELAKESDTDKTIDAYLASQQASDTTSIEVFGNNPDQGIQQLRQAMERERQALVALRTTIQSRETATAAFQQANENAERARSAVGDQLKTISDSFTKSNQDMGHTADAWPAYYRAMASGARGSGAGETTPPPVLHPPDSAPASAPVPAVVTSGRTAPAVPISRYTGSWTFLPGVSTYHGLAPLSFDAVVREEGGQLIGTVNAQFIVTGKADPSVRLSFSGPLQTRRMQTFPLKTAEGVPGSLDLIPGNAFNLLEVNYTLEGASAKVHESDVILVKR